MQHFWPENAVPDQDDDSALVEERLERALDRIDKAARRRRTAPPAAAPREVAARLDALIAKLSAAVSGE